MPILESSAFPNAWSPVLSLGNLQRCSRECNCGCECGHVAWPYPSVSMKWLILLLTKDKKIVSEIFVWDPKLSVNDDHNICFSIFLLHEVHLDQNSYYFSFTVTLRSHRTYKVSPPKPDCAESPSIFVTYHYVMWVMFWLLFATVSLSINGYKSRTYFIVLL